MAIKLVPVPFNAFTTSHNGIADVLRNSVHVQQAFSDGKAPGHHSDYNYVGIWDTGATQTCISPKVAEELNLAPIGRGQISTAGGKHPVFKYLVSIMLPNKVEVKNIPVFGANFTGGDVLIGMDIISKGDFSVTNAEGITKFSFRIPSMEHIDYVEQTKKGNPAVIKKNKIQRNVSCPCGSGKKYKKCCGK